MTGFIITGSWIEDDAWGKEKKVEVTGPTMIDAAVEDRLRQGEGTPFRMYDCDGTLYYEGRLLGEWDGEDGFMPLDCFGEPAAGCTEIKYLNPATQEWETL